MQSQGCPGAYAIVCRGIGKRLDGMKTDADREVEKARIAEGTALAPKDQNEQDEDEEEEEEEDKEGTKDGKSKTKEQKAWFDEKPADEDDNDETFVLSRVSDSFIKQTSS